MEKAQAEAQSLKIELDITQSRAKEAETEKAQYQKNGIGPSRRAQDLKPLLMKAKNDLERALKNQLEALEVYVVYMGDMPKEEVSTSLLHLSMLERVIRSNSIATISRSKEVTDARSPYIPNYSSRGPNPFTPNILKHITGNNKLKCTKGSSISATDLNYPSFALPTSTSESITHVFHRTVANVGSAHSKYKAKVVPPKGLNVIVSPSVLSFTSIGQKLSFTVTLKGKINGVIASTSLLWNDGTFQVRSPSIVYIAP
ncbi:hypothetical protein FEM48_Zijuj03G0064800 [Ziziphus jujuba var. spinosa]|uniref:Subtilisin-like protease fibronectin type-III domain-containing protein n=1 Tax=Ziziphus jujuba var. spinosa TaxID=714518 RepID=A0A978VNQ5_ZIZJJ|nr:hypothetical protein FEM48_Zijuj03G0064800 [Ziziphus jujuba var. spinosa]